MNKKAWLLLSSTSIALVAPLAVAQKAQNLTSVTGIQLLVGVAKLKGITLTDLQMKDLLAQPAGSTAQTLTVLLKVPLSTINKLASKGEAPLTAGELTVASVEIATGKALTPEQQKQLTDAVNNGQVEPITNLEGASDLITNPAGNPVIDASGAGVTQKG